jgi:GNAT superfamily N-acetyltransferase
MARHAGTIEDRPLPVADAPDVVEVLPPSLDAAIVAVGEAGAQLGAVWWHWHRPPLARDADDNPLPELTVAVVEHARGKGIGTKLIEELAATAAARGFAALVLNVHLRNPAARLYTRTGFYVEGRGRGPFGVAMRRDL